MTYSEHDLISFKSISSFDGSTAPDGTVISSTTGSVSEHNDEWTTHPNYGTQGNHGTEKDDSVRVLVSGQAYTLSETTFQQMDRLPWKWADDSDLSTPENELPCKYHLYTAPALFEVILDYITYGMLPDIGKINKADLEELALMTVMLDLVELKYHIDKKCKRKSSKILSYGSAIKNSIKAKHELKKQQKIEREKRIQDELFQVQQLSSLDSKSTETNLYVMPARSSSKIIHDNEPRMEATYQSRRALDVGVPTTTTRFTLNRSNRSNSARNGTNPKMSHFDFCNSFGVVE